jgi:hypothetical protein
MQDCVFFSESIRKKVRSEVSFYSDAFVNYIDVFVREYNKTIFQYGDITEYEKVKIYAEELMYVILCFLCKISEIRRFTFFHPQFLNLIEDHVHYQIYQVNKVRPKNRDQVFKNMLLARRMSEAALRFLIYFYEIYDANYSHQLQSYQHFPFDGDDALHTPMPIEVVNYVQKAIDSRGGESLICNIQYLAIEEMVLQAKLKADKKKTTSKKKSQPKPSTIITNNFNAPISNFAQEQHVDTLTTK